MYPYDMCCVHVTLLFLHTLSQDDVSADEVEASKG